MRPRGAVLNMSLYLLDDETPFPSSIHLPEDSLIFTLQAVSFGQYGTAQKKDLNQVTLKAS